MTFNYGMTPLGTVSSELQNDDAGTLIFYPIIYLRDREVVRKGVTLNSVLSTA